MLFLIAAVLALLKCQIFLSNGGGGGILKLFGGDRMNLMKVEFHCQESGWVDLL